jgi:hypothetical protein
VAITTAVVVPHPPLLIPELGRGHSPGLGELRSACLRAVEVALAGADALLLVGGGPAWGRAAPGAAGSFAPYGAAVDVFLPVACRHGRDWLDHDRLAAALPRTLSTPGRLVELPLSLAVAAWLLAAAGQVVPRLAAFAVPAVLDPTAAAALGRTLASAAESAGTVSLLAAGDLSACRTPAAPGAFHPLAAEFDQRVGQAIRDAAPSRLLALDPGLAARLGVGGLVPLQVLAGALAQAGPMRGEVLYEDAPCGVGYLVATLVATLRSS